MHTLAGGRVRTRNVIKVRYRRGKISVVGAARGAGFVSEELALHTYVVSRVQL